MTRPLPMEIYISDIAFFGFIMIAPAIGFALLGLILLIAKNKKAAKVCFIIAGCSLLIAIGLCGLD